MDMTDKILLGLLVLAFAAFPVAVFLYLRTAYQKGGWREVKAAAFVAVICMLLYAAVRLGPEWEIRHILRALRHPFALSSIFFILLTWRVHRALKSWLGGTHDYD